ncbi:DUF2975 domain-containing protein [Flavobacterium salilacus subsp. salilacus]|uniref:DUF2975 domain-containing protein n=1 Tax=Flavobacterium TaxID=237 RepID=UPI001074E8F5|nr:MULTISPECIES: DUF2975 domain-containing protein [Flavobacterium]KAF2518873.1 DUF2975 domain-containing protein [Flavobacterium salilacus subsp. salilacus]MBE1614967.1 DUF2975 domain-containing protein [Flavobacterium sp. SaA2.13]
MRRLWLLKSLIDIVYFFAIIGIIFGLPMIFMIAVMPNEVPFDIAVSKNGEIVENKTSWEIIVSMFIIYIGYAFQVYAIYLFRKILVLFRKRIIFDVSVIKNFDQMGKAILIGYVTILLPVIFFALTSSHVEVKLNFMINDSFLIPGIGLFFIVLSEVFQMAKDMKEENELTV